MPSKIKIVSSLPTKEKIAKKIGATEAEIRSVDRLLATPLRPDELSSIPLTKTPIKIRGAKKVIYRAGKAAKSAGKVGKSAASKAKSRQVQLLAAASNGAVSIKDLIALKRHR